MDEELIDYLFETSRREGFKKNREDFVKYLQSDDELFDYLYGKAQKEGYKKDKAHFAGLVGRTTTAAPVATTEPAKTEVVAATTEPTKTEPTTTAATTTPAKTEPTETAPAKTEPAKELSNKQSETIKVRSIPQREVEMPVADETKMPPMMVREAAPIAEEEPKKELPVSTGLIPVTEKTEVKAVETPSDKMVIKSEKKAEEPIKPMTEKEKEEWECPPAQGGCSKNKQSITNYFLDKYKIGGEYKPEFSRARISDREGNLADFIDNSFDGRGVAKIENEDWYDHNSKGYYYIAEENPKSKRFSVYNVPVDGKETSLIYDNKTGVIMKETNEDVKSEDGKPMKTWLNVPFKYDEYNTLKAEIDKAKGGTTAPKVSTVPTLEPWQQPQGTMQVKEVTEQPKAEVKAEEPKGIPSYDDLGINPEKDPGSFLGANKNVKFEKLSPDEIIEKGYLKGIGSDIKLERNVSLRYPDPPGTVFKKEKVGEREVYSSYDKANDKWYIYDENSNKNNWTEVEAGSVKTLLNSKYKENNKIIDSKTDYNSEEEEKEMTSMRRSIMLNKYLPYVMKNWDNFSNEQQTKIKKDLDTGGLNILMRKELEKNDPNLDFWLDVNDKIFKNQATSSNAIDVYREGSENIYPSKLIEIPTLKKDVDEGRIKLLRSVAGDIFYDEKNDVFYYGEAFDRGELKRTKDMVSEGDGEGYKEITSQTYLKTIKKGTPAYDKIKSSLSKYNR